MRNFLNALHIVLGCIFWNYICHITGLNKINLTIGNVLGISLVTFIFGSVFGGGHEWSQKVFAKINFDKYDILNTIIGFLLGAIFSFVFPNLKSQTAFILSLVFYAVYWVWLLNRKVK